MIHVSQKGIPVRCLCTLALLLLASPALAQVLTVQIPALAPTEVTSLELLPDGPRFAGRAQSVQVNPCTVPAIAVANPSTGYLQLPEFATVQEDKTFLVEAVELGAFASVEDMLTGAPVSSVVVPRAALTLVPGTTDCYRTPVAITAPTATVVAGRVINQFGTSAWVPGNPFFRAGAPSAPVSVRLGTAGGS